MAMIFINYTIYNWLLGHSPTGQYGRFHCIGRTATNAKCTPHQRWVVRPLQGQSASTTVRLGCMTTRKTSSQGPRVRDRQQTRNQCNQSNIWADAVDVVDAVFRQTPG